MKNVFKKIIALAVVVVTCLTFTACFGNDKEIINAYDIAVKNGFKGTEQEWLESLKGTDGKDGINGINGKDGKDATEISIEDLYESAKQNGYDGTFLEFLKEYVDSKVTDYDAETAINSALFSAVSVVAEFQVLNDNQLTTGYSMGAGVIYKLDKENGDAFVITNYHVIHNSSAYGTNKLAKAVKLFLYGQEVVDYAIEATIVGGSMTYDIAVLNVDNSEVLKNSNATPVTFGDSNHIKVGSTAIAIGNPDGAGISATKGIISVDSEYIDLQIDDSSEPIQYRSIRLDAAINPGNSGGGMFNAKGELVGIVNAKIVSSDVEGVGYAIPGNLAKAVAENIIWNASHGKIGVIKGLMGITVSAEESSAVYNDELQMTQIVENVVVQAVNVGSLAFGKIFVGDTLVSIEHNDNLIEITRTFFIVDYMLNVRPGDSFTITLIRNNQEVKVVLTIQEKHFTSLA